MQMSALLKVLKIIIITLNLIKLSNEYPSILNNSTLKFKSFINLPQECIPDHQALDDFPHDFFTEEERLNGYIIFHILLSVYIFILLTIICEYYFVPSLNYISKTLNIRDDVSGATFMAVGSSAPTVFIAIISVFFVEDAADIGVGTIVGSTVFNTLFIIGCTCYAVPNPVKIDWFPFIRDTIAYLCSTFTLIISVSDSHVNWYEAFIFILIYSLYLFAIFNNEKLESFAFKIHSYLFNAQTKVLNFKNTSNLSSYHYLTIFEFPKSFSQSLTWILGFFIILIYDIFTPQYLNQNHTNFFNIMRFFLSIILLGILSYILVWMVCIIGSTFNIPDCVMGMTFLAAGSSIPDVMASVIVSKKGNANMSVANAVGSNVFDMLCLGLPWFIKTAFVNPGSTVEIQNQSPILSTGLLFGSMIYSLTMLYLNNWKLTKRLGFMFIFTYLATICN